MTPEGEFFARLPHWRFYPKNRIAAELLPEVENIFINYENRPKVIDLFCGGGGLSLGFESAGCDVVLALDNDKEACDAHRINFPTSITAHHDITKVSKDFNKYLKSLNINPNSIDGIIGGPPCQGFSLIGERSSMDERNLLTSHFMQIVLQVKPAFFVMENVLGLKSYGIAPDFDTYVSRLSNSIGEPASRIVDALPSVPRSIAVRERQFRKKLVSGIICTYQERISADSGLNQASLDESISILQSDFEKGLFEVYSSVSEFDYENVRNNIKGDVSVIAFSSVMVELVKRKLLKKKYNADDAKIALQDAPILMNILISLAKIHASLPKAEKYKGEKVGPVLYHLIQQASTLYHVEKPVVLNSVDYGTPQSRQRMFLIGFLKKNGIPFEMPEKTHFYAERGGNKELSLLGVRANTAKDAIEDIPNVDDFPELVEQDKLPLNKLKAADSSLSLQARLEEIPHGDLSLPRKDWNPFLVTNLARTHHEEHIVERMKQTPEGKPDAKSHKPRLHRDKPSNTLRAGTREGKGSHTAVRPIHYEYNRVIAVREGARLMGYPDWMEFHKAKWHGMRLVGNGVPRQLGEALARSIRAFLSGSKESPSGSDS